MVPQYFGVTTGGWEPLDAPPAGALLAADSFLVEDGAARFVARHRRRFQVSADISDEFWRQALALVPARGRWFPRFELRAATANKVAFAVRPAPPLTTHVDLVVSPNDPRTQPTVKGPDLESLIRLRTQLGAEPVFVDAAGSLVEGATTALAWWDGSGPVCFSSVADRVPSVTEAGVREILLRRGLAVQDSFRRPDQLRGWRVWALNALHGWRPARTLTVGETQVSLAQEAAPWERLLVADLAGAAAPVAP